MAKKNNFFFSAFAPATCGNQFEIFGSKKTGKNLNFWGKEKIWKRREKNGVAIKSIFDARRRYCFSSEPFLRSDMFGEEKKLNGLRLTHLQEESEDHINGENGVGKETATRKTDLDTYGVFEDDLTICE